MLHGILMTESYVGETSEVAGWGTYDIGAMGTLVKDDTTNSSPDNNQFPMHILLYSTLIPV
jgi:hypothetical protein